MNDASSQRTELLRGLRELASYLESTPELPAPHSIEVLYAVIKEDDAAERIEVDRIGAMLGEEPHEECEGEHYVVERAFGELVTYRIVSVSQNAMRKHQAGSTYIDVVTPEEWPI